jgi:hypothetical protein
MIICSAFSRSINNDSFVLSDSIDISLRDIFLSLISGLGKSPGMLVDLDPRFLSFASRLIGMHDSFLQLSSELLVDSGRFRALSNWHPFLDPYVELELTAQSFLY